MPAISLPAHLVFSSADNTVTIRQESLFFSTNSVADCLAIP